MKDAMPNPPATSDDEDESMRAWCSCSTSRPNSSRSEGCGILVYMLWRVSFDAR